MPIRRSRRAKVTVNLFWVNPLNGGLLSRNFLDTNFQFVLAIIYIRIVVYGQTNFEFNQT